MNTAPGPDATTPSMFGTLVESRRERGSPLRMVALQIAIAAHALVLLTIAVDKWLEVPPIPAPAARRVDFVPTPPPPPPPAPKPTPVPAAPPVETPMPEGLVQPVETPIDIVTAPIAAPTGSESGVEGGVEGGVDGGVPGGEMPPEPTIYRLGEGATPPEQDSKVEPEYPSMARSARVQGTVILRVVILADGTVGDIETLRGQSMGLTEAAIAAVRQWHYKPALLDGVPVPFQMTVLVHFKLSN